MSDVFVAIEPCGCVAGATALRRPEAVADFFREMKGIKTVAMPVEEFRARLSFCNDHPDGPPYWPSNGGEAMSA